MRLLAILGLALLGTAATCHADDRQEDRAKSAALAFAKALKANDIPATMREVGVPFLFYDLEAKRNRLEKLEKLDTVVATLKPLAGEKTGFPTAAGEILPLAAYKKAVEKEPRDVDRDATVQDLVDVGGADGFLVFLVDDSKEQAGVLLVRIKGESAKVVGIMPVIRTVRVEQP